MSKNKSFNKNQVCRCITYIYCHAYYTAKVSTQNHKFMITIDNPQIQVKTSLIESQNEIVHL